MSDAVLIRDPQLRERDGWLELGAEVDGERLWFQVPQSVGLATRGEPFIAAGLLEAMYRNVSIEVTPELPLSPLLAENLTEIQAVYHCWNHELTPIDISARLEESSASAGLVASCYSGGVDSALTFVRRREELDALVLVLGFDVDGPDDDWDDRIARHQRFAETMGKRLIPLKTNAREFCVKRKICWNFGHGLFLAALAPLLGCEKFYIPSSHTYDQLFPWGSHPLTDPMWSTAQNRVVHCGSGYSRANKVRALCAEQAVLDNIQVCRRSNNKNCGSCPKCVRTMVALHMLGGRSSALPDLSDMQLLEQLKPADENGLAFLEDAMVLAKETGSHEIYQQLKKYHKRYQLAQLIPTLDRLILGGLIRGMYRKLRKPAWLDERVMLLARDQWSL